jgi:glycosyltransferase involved in cell wall biosynthesis
MGQPRVSVLLPVRNGRPWLVEALESLAAQTLRDFELIVIEDGSTDGTPELLSDWRDDRLRVIAAGGVGMAAALNLGLDAARAPLVARHDADDTSAPGRLEAQCGFLDRHEQIGVLATVADYIDAGGRTVDNQWVRAVRAQHDAALTSEEIARLMPLTCCVTHGSIVARTAVVRAAGGYQRHIWPVEDYDLWLRLLPETAFAKLPERLYRYRIHDAQQSAAVRDRQLTQALAAKFRHLRRACPQLPVPARLAIAGAGRGADCYRALAASHGFEVVPYRDDFDVVVVADFADLDACADRYGAETPGGAAIRIGNFFIPRRRGRHAA